MKYDIYTELVSNGVYCDVANNFANILEKFPIKPGNVIINKEAQRETYNDNKLHIIHSLSSRDFAYYGNYDFDIDKSVSFIIDHDGDFAVNINYGRDSYDYLQGPGIYMISNIYPNYDDYETDAYDEIHYQFYDKDSVKYWKEHNKDPHWYYTVLPTEFDKMGLLPDKELEPIEKPNDFDPCIFVANIMNDPISIIKKFESQKVKRL